jgi:predicted TIM-barrel fold metal-dependent hydrolase
MAVADDVRTDRIDTRAVGLRAIDTDVHNDLPSFDELREFLPDVWHDWLDDDGPQFAARAYANTGSGRMEDAVREEDGLCAGDPAWVVQQLLEKYQIDVGILTGTLFALGVQNNARFCAAIARAYNDWTLEKWVRPRDCFKGSIVVTTQDPDAAVSEIHRLGDDPGMVQVLFPGTARIPYGNQYYWPIYRAAVEHGLPIGIHISDSLGIANPQTSVGYPSTYLEYHTDHSLSMMAHCISLVAEGAFEEFPSLRFVFIEGGVCWAPYVMWRLDRLYPALRAEAPRLKRLPSEYVLNHCYFSTQPIEEPANPRHLLEMFTMLRAERTVLFASDYPHWDFDNIQTAFGPLPATLKRRILVENALDLYGARLLAGRTRR